MSIRLASLGMYDGGELTAANDALWSAIVKRLDGFGVRDVPYRLERNRSLDDLWASESLLFGQICGYPFAAHFRDRLRLIATPEYSAPGCSEGNHRSFVLVHARSRFENLNALRGSRAVINDVESMTGRHLFGEAIAAVGGSRGFFSSVEISGSHAASLASVATGTAEVAAIDCVSYAHLARDKPELVAGTRVIHRTRATPALPFVISAACGEAEASLVARALADAIEDPLAAAACRALGLIGVRRPNPKAYEQLLDVGLQANPAFDLKFNKKDIVST